MLDESNEIFIWNIKVNLSFLPANKLWDRENNPKLTWITSKLFRRADMSANTYTAMDRAI